VSELGHDMIRAGFEEKGEKKGMNTDVVIWVNGAS
jgi:hypothetical protein